MHLPRKQAEAGALPAVLHQFQARGTRLKHRGEPHKLIQVGVIPTPATTLRISSTEPLSKAAVLSSNEPKTPMPSPERRGKQRVV